MLVCVVALLVLLVSLISALLHPYLAALFWMLYAMTYFSRPEATGHWRQDWFRSLALWRSVGGAACHMQNERLLEEVTAKDRLLFVAGPNTTMIPLFWTFGLHGPSVLQGLDVVFAVPRVLLWIPGLREVLMMAGAIEDRRSTIERRLQKGDSVVMCTSGARAVFYDQLPGESRVEAFDSDWARFCIDNNVSVVPVVFVGETGRYELHQPHPTGALAALRHITYKEFGYPAPITFSFNPRCPLVTVVSAPIAAHVYREADNVNGLVQAVHSGWRGIGNTGSHVLVVMTPSDSH